jgi:hypothetical protein
MGIIDTLCQRQAQPFLGRDGGLPVLRHIRKGHDQLLAVLPRIRMPGGIANAFKAGLQQPKGLD